MSKKISHDIGRAILLLLPFNVGSCVSLGENHASSYLVCHCRVPRGLCRESAYAYTFVDHMDSGAWNCRLDYRRSGNASVLSTKRRGRFHPGGLIVSILGAILVLYLWHRFHLQVPCG